MAQTHESFIGEYYPDKYTKLYLIGGHTVLVKTSDVPSPESKRACKYYLWESTMYEGSPRTGWILQPGLAYIPLNNIIYYVKYS